MKVAAAIALTIIGALFGFLAVAMLAAPDVPAIREFFETPARDMTFGQFFLLVGVVVSGMVAAVALAGPRR